MYHEEWLPGHEAILMVGLGENMLGHWNGKVQESNLLNLYFFCANHSKSL